MIRNISITLLLISTIFLIFISFKEFTLLEISGNSKENYYPKLRIYNSLCFSILISLSLTKKIKLQTIINLIWVIPVTYLFFYYIFGLSNLKKIDFLFGREVSKVKVTEYKVRDFPVKEIILLNKKKNDTIYYSGNPCCDKVTFTLQDIQNAKITKSWLTGYYYISASKNYSNITEIDDALQ